MVTTLERPSASVIDRTETYVRWFEDLTKTDTAIAGGKGANLGEMTHAGLPVPPGFTVTAAAYHDFLDKAGLREIIDRRIGVLDVTERPRTPSGRSWGRISTSFSRGR